MIEIGINRQEFIDYFLNPIKKINVEGTCSLYAKEGELISIAATTDKSCMLYAKHIPAYITQDEFEMVHISDVKRLILALKCIKNEDVIKLNLDEEKLYYDEKKFKFSTYLLDGKFVPKVGLNPQKVDAMETDLCFNVKPQTLKDLNIAQMIAPDASKFYFISEGEQIFINLNDKMRSKIDNASLILSEESVGTPLKEPFIINGGILKMITQFKEDIVFKINSRIGALIIESITDKYKLKYITSALTK